MCLSNAWLCQFWWNIWSLRYDILHGSKSSQSVSSWLFCFVAERCFGILSRILCISHKAFYKHASMIDWKTISNYLYAFIDAINKEIWLPNTIHIWPCYALFGNALVFLHLDCIFRIEIISQTCEFINTNMSFLFLKSRKVPQSTIGLKERWWRPWKLVWKPSHF